MNPVAAVRADMLGQLMELLGRGAAAPAPLAGPKVGQTLSATVLGPAGPDRLALLIEGKPVVAAVDLSSLPPAARQAGAELALILRAAGPTPRLELAGVSQPEAAAVSRSAAVERPGAAAAPPSAPAAEAIRAAMAQAGARQASVAPVFAALGALASPEATVASPLPPAAALIARSILAMRLDGERPIEPEALKAAVADAAVPAPARAVRGEPPLDLRLLLLALKAALPHSAPARSQGIGPPPPEPLHRDATPAALKPLPAAPIGDPASALADLARDAGQAAERVRLGHLASLPDTAGRPAAEAAKPTQQHLVFELPIALGQQTALAGFRVTRDRRAPEAEGAPSDVWGVRFAVATDAMGEVHAHLRLASGALSVSLWAEDPTTRAVFAAHAPALAAALRESAVDPGEIRVHAGLPAEPPAEAGRFLDRAS